MSGKDRKNSDGKLRFLDIFIIVFFISLAIIFVDMFRHDLMHTFNLLNTEPVGTVVVEKNTVQRRLSDRVLWDRLARESPVYVGDLIRVADISAATLYIQNNSIDLEENTLVRITLSPDGEGFQIVLSQGTLTFYAEEGAGRVTLNIDGQHVVPEPGVILSAGIAEDGSRFSQTIGIITRENPAPAAVSPAFNSMFRFQENLPVISFQWTEIEEAVSYIFEAANTPDFINPKIQRQTSTAFLTDSGFEEGTWYWRVTPVYSPVYGGSAEPSSPAFFRVEHSTAVTSAASVDFSQWLEMEAPSSELPQGFPAELIPVGFIKEDPIPEPEPEPEPQPVVVPPAPPSPPVLLAAPQNLRPARGTSYGHEQLQSQRSITFNWAAVQDANAYIYTLYQQTASGRQQVFRTTVSGNNYTLTNLRVLDRGTFVWQVEPVNIGRDNSIQRRGRVVENSFVVDFPAPGPVHIEETGILYGN